MFKKLSGLVGFTETETKVILFLLAAFLVGFSIKMFFISEQQAVYKQFDYSDEDSLFNRIKSISKTEEQRTNLTEKVVDYKSEVLDFNKLNFRENKQDIIPAKRSININKAGVDELIKLPGIGTKTAKKIIDYRNTNGSFKNLEELLNVKGIGNSKLDKIKPYIFIE